MNIAIDGPAGAGKSSIARKVAKELGYIYVDTGALYRGIAYHMLTKNILADDEIAVAKELQHIEIELCFINNEQRVLLCGVDISEKIRTSEVSKASSQVSAIPEVRGFLINLQKKLAAENHVIMDGRDIGTVVLPHADIKIFLTASPEERATRRCKELSEKEMLCDFETILHEIRTRDYNDAHRKISPLVPAEDAMILDTTALTMAEVITKIKEMIHNS